MKTVLTVLASLFVFGLIIFIHEFGHYITAKLSKIKVNEFSIGMGPKLFNIKGRETVYSLRLLPIGGFCSMEGEDDESDDEHSFGKAPVGNRILVVIAGAIMNLVLGFIVLTIMTATDEVIATRKIRYFEDGAMTQSSGLKVDDTIVAINGRNMYVVDDIVYELLRIKDGTADVTVIRDGKRVTVDNVKFNTAYDENNGQSYIQYDFKVYPEEITFGNVLRESSLWTLSMVRLIFVSLVDLLTGNAAINQLSGPVGIVSVISEATSAGLYSIAYILAMITINLGVCNLLPLPALDGGRLVFLIFEALTGKKLNPKYESVINIAGFVLLMLLMVFVTYNDISRLFTR